MCMRVCLTTWGSHFLRALVQSLCTFMTSLLASGGAPRCVALPLGALTPLVSRPRHSVRPQGPSLLTRAVGSASAAVRARTAEICDRYKTGFRTHVRGMGATLAAPQAVSLYASTVLHPNQFNFTSPGAAILGAGRPPLLMFPVPRGRIWRRPVLVRTRQRWPRAWWACLA